MRQFECLVVCLYCCCRKRLRSQSDLFRAGRENILGTFGGERLSPGRVARKRSCRANVSTRARIFFRDKSADEPDLCGKLESRLKIARILNRSTGGTFGSGACCSSVFRRHQIVECFHHKPNESRKFRPSLLLLSA